MSAPAAIRRCAGCGTELAPSLLACPSCSRLVHAERLAALARDAEAAGAEGRAADALAAWRGALELLPAGTAQRAQVEARLVAVSKQVDASAPSRPDGKSHLGKILGGLGAVGLLLWKLKAVVALVLGKGKLLLLGLTKVQTLYSMFLFLGVYWALWGWKFAAGFVAAIYVHEIGHVAALRRYGIRASAPMFIPGFGAVVRLDQYPADAREDARVGLAGPVWGAGAAAAFWVAGVALGSPLLLAVAKAAAWMNIFNLLPIWQLDGARGFRALSKPQRFLAAGALFAGWLLTGEMLAALVGAVVAGRAFFSEAPEEGDRIALLEFAGTALALCALMAVDPGVSGP